MVLDWFIWSPIYLEVSFYCQEGFLHAFPTSLHSINIISINKFCADVQNCAWVPNNFFQRSVKQCQTVPLAKPFATFCISEQFLSNLIEWFISVIVIFISLIRLLEIPNYHIQLIPVILLCAGLKSMKRWLSIPNLLVFPVSNIMS